MSIIGAPLKDWIPYRLKETGDAANCEWLYLGNYAFDEPFFDETISHCRQLKENSQMRRVISDVSMLSEWASELFAITPTAFIFHVSRCGSTLLSQLLAQNPANIVLSEVPFFDELLQKGFRNNSMEKILPLLKDAITFYGKKRNEKQEHLFIKADSWHIHFYTELRQLFPQTPFLLLSRRPDEVVRSHQKLRGMQAVQGVIEPALFGFDETIFHIPLDEYTANVLETYYNAFAEILQKDKLAFAFDYKDGMMNIIQKMMAACNITVAEEQLESMKERSSCHSKFPEQAFSEKAITGVPPEYLEKAFHSYNELEKLRLTHPPTS